MASKPTNRKNTQKKSQAQKSQMNNRREMTGLICIALALLGFLCYFNTDAFLLSPLTKLIGGLFGQLGRYILPLVLVYTALIPF